jgi:hypothetical protein
MTSIDIMFFCLPLSTMKWSGVPFTHICEWKRCSPSSGSSSSTLMVEMVILGSKTMIHFPFSGSELESKSTSVLEDFVSTNNDCLEKHSLIFCQGIFWNTHHFLVSFFDFPLPFFAGGLEWLYLDWASFLCPFLWERGPPLLGFCCDGFIEPKSRLFFCLKFC